MTDLWYEAFWKLGEISGCHQMPERSFFVRGKQFPVCARCTGAFVGYCVGGFAYVFFKIPIYIAIAFCAVMFVDWLIQRLKIVKSTNLRRFVTGLLCGFAIIQMYLTLIVFIVNKIILF